MIRALILASLIAAPTARAADPFVSSTDAVGKVWHLRVDADATWGIGAQMYLGALAHAEGQLTVWHTGRATGTFDLGARVAYGNEAGFLAPWNDPDEIQGAGHRVATQAVLGTTFHFTPQRRVGLGLHLLAGHNVVVRDYTLTYADEGFTADTYDVRHDLIVSADLTISVRVARQVGLNLALTAPLPTDSSYVVGLGSIGLGVSFYAR